MHAGEKGRVLVSLRGECHGITEGYERILSNHLSLNLEGTHLEHCRGQCGEAGQLWAAGSRLDWTVSSKELFSPQQFWGGGKLTSRLTPWEPPLPSLPRQL